MKMSRNFSRPIRHYTRHRREVKRMSFELLSELLEERPLDIETAWEAFGDYMTEAFSSESDIELY